MLYPPRVPAPSPDPAGARCASRRERLHPLWRRLPRASRAGRCAARCRSRAREGGRAHRRDLGRASQAARGRRAPQGRRHGPRAGRRPPLHVGARRSRAFVRAGAHRDHDEGARHPGPAAQDAAVPARSVGEGRAGPVRGLRHQAAGDRGARRLVRQDARVRGHRRGRVRTHRGAHRRQAQVVRVRPQAAARAGVRARGRAHPDPDGRRQRVRDAQGARGRGGAHRDGRWPGEGRRARRGAFDHAAVSEPRRAGGGGIPRASCPRCRTSRRWRRGRSR